MLTPWPWPWRPNYVSHKQVEAYPLERLEHLEGGELRAVVRLENGVLVGLVVPADIVARGEPQPGSLLVRYPPTERHPDGYLSFSPADAFAAGYVPIPRAMPPFRPRKHVDPSLQDDRGGLGRRPHP